MMAEDYVLHNGSLYDYTAGVYCGVLVKENVMRKLVALQHKHMEAVKQILTDEADKGNVFPSMWTLHYPEGEQTTVHYIDTSEDVYRLIDTAVYGHQPRHIPLVFVAGSMEEAKAMADAHYNQHRNSQDG